MKTAIPVGITISIVIFSFAYAYSAFEDPFGQVRQASALNVGEARITLLQSASKERLTASAQEHRVTMLQELRETAKVLAPWTLAAFGLWVVGMLGHRALKAFEVSLRSRSAPVLPANRQIGTTKDPIIMQEETRLHALARRNGYRVIEGDEQGYYIVVDKSNEVVQRLRLTLAKA